MTDQHAEFSSEADRAPSAAKRTLFIKTCGCQMNVYDSERMADVLKPHGFDVVDAPETADVVILNTCHIREKAAEKVYSEVGRLRQLSEARAKEGKDMVIGVAGCVAQAEGAEMMRRAPIIDLVLGPQTYHRLPDLMRQVDKAKKSGRSARVLDTDFPAEAKFDYMPQDVGAKGPTAFLTVQEGCDKFCTFCVVPYTRGAEFSRPVDDIMDEARRLVASGVMEITLLGQNVNAYHGLDAEGTTQSLGYLITRLAEIPGLNRIRYTTSHPRDMDDELYAAHRDIKACMPYLHLPVQSGSDRILAAMNRQHDRETYFRIIERLREARPDIALSGDFIVGFPGETDEDFEDTMDLVRRVNYAQAYSFKYSPRPGTPASTLGEQVPEDVKSARLKALQELLNSQQLAFNEASIGKVMDVILERPGKEPGQLIGRTPYLQAVHVNVTSSEYSLDEGGSGAYDLYLGRMVSVKIEEAGPNSLRGRLVDA